ncbi:MAG: hypothetical protein ACFFBH_03620 [Promethearchaeota archaeon]
MSVERRIDIFSALISTLSIIALIMVIIGPFAGTFNFGYGYYYYSCLYCENWTTIDLITQIFIIILLILQFLIALNELLPKKIISNDLTMIGIIMAGLTWTLALIGLASFGIWWGFINDFEWWPELGFYGSLVGGILNMILFILKFKNK